MLSLPQSADSPSPSDCRDGLPAVHLTDTAELLDTLLLFCLPRDSPSLDDLAVVSRIVEGSRKYLIDRASQAARNALVALAAREPVRAYAIACHYGLEAEPRQAALLCLRLPLMSLADPAVDELGLIDCRQLCHLLQYREACRKAVTVRVYSVAWLRKYRQACVVPDRGLLLWGRTCCGKLEDHQDSLGQDMSIRSWWGLYMKDTVRKLGDCTWEGTVRFQDAVAAFLMSGSCGNCSAVAFEHLEKLTTAMAKEVAKQIANVRRTFSICVLTRLQYLLRACRSSSSSTLLERSSRRAAP